RLAPPRAIDRGAVRAETVGSGWQSPPRVVFDAPPAEVAPWIRPPMGRLEPLDDGCLLVGSTRNPDMYVQDWLAGMPFAFRIDGGDELRAAAATLAARFTAAVADQPPPPGPR
ncbi:ArsR family transcriptional regulator, partial [Streptomyces sp. NPDC059409]